MKMPALTESDQKKTPLALEWFSSANGVSRSCFHSRPEVGNSSRRKSVLGAEGLSRAIIQCRGDASSPFYWVM
jgi:hypothetical protein